MANRGNSARVKRGTGQQHLLESAQQLFEEFGYRGATTKDIARKAGVSENLIFRYFDSKSELFMASVATPFLDALAHAIEAWREDERYRTTSEEEILRGFMREILELSYTHRSSVRAIVAVVGEHNSDIDTGHIRARVSAILGKISPEIGRFVTQKGLKITDPSLLVRLGVITAVANLMLIPDSYGPDEDPPDRDVIAEQLVLFISHGLQAPTGGQAAAQI